MNLRSRDHLARPGRYREDEYSHIDLGRPSQLFESRPFNPDLRSPWNTIDRPPAPNSPAASQATPTTRSSPAFVFRETRSEKIDGKDEEEERMNPDPGDFDPYEVSWLEEDGTPAKRIQVSLNFRV
jgi:hypothetical protein